MSPCCRASTFRDFSDVRDPDDVWGGRIEFLVGEIVAGSELLEVFVSVDSANGDQLLLLHDLPNAFDADLAAFLL